MDVKLPPEVVVKIYQYLDPVSALALGSCSTKLQQILIDHSFKNILDQVDYGGYWEIYDVDDEQDRKMSINSELVKNLMNFIDLVPDKKESDKLTLDMIITISSKFPSHPWQKIEVMVQESFHSLSVDPWGFLLLTQTRASLRLKSVEISRLSRDLLVALGSLVEQEYPRLPFLNQDHAEI